MKLYNHFINGKWIEPIKNEYFDTETHLLVRFGQRLGVGAKKMRIWLLKPQKLHSIRVPGRICDQRKGASF